MDIEKFIPVDKSWFIRIAFLKYLAGKPLPPAPADANDDIKSFLYASSMVNQKNQRIDIGESGTAFRFLQFYAWKLNLGTQFIKGPMLTARNICSDKNIVNLTQEELLSIDNTSQWASAAALCGDTHRIQNPPYKLGLTYNAITVGENANAHRLDRK